jgi:hypothetical protein
MKPIHFLYQITCNSNNRWFWDVIFVKRPVEVI